MKCPLQSLAWWLGVASFAGVLAPLARADSADVEFFEKRIRPVLIEHCYRCHSSQSKSVKGGLRVDSRDGLLKGGDSGPALVPGKPDESLLVKSVRYVDSAPHMPPKGKLPENVVADLARWIAAGAADPRLPDTPPKPIPVATEKSNHWAYQPLRPPPLPAVKDRTWAQTPVDLFIQAAREQRGLAAAAAADRKALIRRVTYDLIGLPPTPEEVEAFLADRAPVAFERVVDRLLASPHYGERWGRHWLDVVRYADTAGETADFPAPHAWRYRNYVIQAFNGDKPYDEFLREQLAGDVLAASGPPDRYAERIVATGYLAVARRFGFDPMADQYLTIEDTIDTLGKSVLGLTLGCARCHDHKYDPVSAHDYYALYGIFDSTKYAFPGSEKEKRPRDMVALTPSAPRPPPGPSPRIEVAYAVQEGKPHNVRLHRRGEPANLGEEVPRRFIQLFGGQPVPADDGSGRLALAGWLTGPAAPLTARVLVNRIWQHHFGAGLVRTPSDFGVRGSRPSHPELLEYLAGRFVAEGWSVKKLHRLMLLSATYQQSAAGNAQRAAVDPENLLLSHFPRRRLGAEEIRDTILAVSGDLDRTPGVAHPFPEEKTWGFTQHNPFTAVYDHDRRSVYLMTQRIKRHPFLGLFDGADPNSTTGARDVTTVPTQALFFLNDPFIHAKSGRLAARLTPLPDDAARLDRLCRLCLGRPPMLDEQRLATRFLAESGSPGGDAARRQQAWAAWARVTFASNEFLYVD